MELTTDLLFEQEVLEQAYAMRPQHWGAACFPKVEHHNEVLAAEYGGCGCAEVIAEGEEKPYFVCVHCKRRVPWCFGGASEDPYLAECCDDCYCTLKAKWPNLIECMEGIPYDHRNGDSEEAD